MNKVTVVSLLLIGFFSLDVQIQAVPQEDRPDIKQKVSDAAKKAATQAEVFYRGEPQFSWIEGTSITYVTNTPETILKIDNVFYFHYTYFNSVNNTTHTVWLVSGSAHGPWTPANAVPESVLAIVCSQIHANPNDPYQLCALPWEHY